MRNVIVTGGTRGLGLAVAGHVAAQGYRAIAVARSKSAEFSSLEERLGRNSLEFVPFDLAEVEELPNLAKQLTADFGPMYGLVNNAGIGTDGALAMMPVSRIERVVRLNTLAPIILSKYVVRRMMADGGGRIVNVASITAFTGYSGLSVYAATKSSMIGFTRSLAREVGRLGINVNAVAPGFMETEMTRQMDPKRREQIAGRSALRRFVCVEDVAKAVGYLLGENARNITGTVLTVDAGATA
ncbi:MAG: SDR family oxidoreductase [Bryobacterales bacterium]|nr:SDR family oxidoreductase [Bryobacterales bacterium]MBV9398787.1 SDR family oxidoreductase [Bryobacterales bacterium]